MVAAGTEFKQHGLVTTVLTAAHWIHLSRAGWLPLAAESKGLQRRRDAPTGGDWFNVSGVRRVGSLEGCAVNRYAGENHGDMLSLR